MTPAGAEGVTLSGAEGVTTADAVAVESACALSRFEFIVKACTAPLPMSDAWSYPVTPLAAFALSGAFDKWDAINAPKFD